MTLDEHRQAVWEWTRAYFILASWSLSLFLYALRVYYGQDARLLLGKEVYVIIFLDFVLILIPFFYLLVIDFICQLTNSRTAAVSSMHSATKAVGVIQVLYTWSPAVFEEFAAYLIEKREEWRQLEYSRTRIEVLTYSSLTQLLLTECLHLIAAPIRAVLARVMK